VTQPFIPPARPLIGEEEIDAVAAVMRTGMIAQGPQVAAFEEEFCAALVPGVQAVAGVEMHAKPGDHITRGAPLFTLHTATPERFERALEALDGAVTCSGSPVTPDPVILGRIDADA